MALEFKLPDIGEGIAEGEVVKWLVKVGDTVAEHQPVVEVMTDKATVEIPAPKAGRISELRAEEGAVVPVGQVLFVLEPVDGKPAAAQAASRPGAESPQRAAPAEKTPAQRPAPAEQPGPADGSAREPAAALPREGARAEKGGTLAFKLPDIGEGIAEGEIVRWLVQEGERVAEHQPVVEVMTDKATVEIPAPAEGVIASIRVQPGQVVPIGTVLFELSTARAAPATRAASQAAPARALAPAAVPAAQESGAEAAAGAEEERADGSSERTRAVPSARRVARELGIDLSQVSGSGRGGIVRRADVEAFATRGAAPEAPAATPARERKPEAAAPVAPLAPGRAPERPPAPAAPRPSFPAPAVPEGPRETRTPFRGVRRKIAEAMARSKTTAAHFTVVEELDVTQLVELREAARKLGEEQGVKVTYMPFLMKATALALARHPELNGTLDDKTQELVTYHYVNLGIAIDTPQGLIVPVVREVQSKGVLQLAAELADLAERTRAGKVKPDELHGGTFTITNAGNIGGILATPIINYPEIGILGVHRIFKRPGVVERPDGDRIEVRQYMNLSVSVDHRLTDGANAARFLVSMKRLLENPGLLAL